jgi:hypothetical protein
MAKDQDLPLNPTKISGVCGRLLCCLSYEHEQYLAIKSELPKRGAWVQTPDGPGEVVTVNVVRETVIVELAGSGVHEEFSPAQIGEATQRVGNVARSRAEEGLTPFAGPPPRPERREPPPRREPKHTGERRLLRDEIDDPDVLDALALLEEGLDERQSAPASEARRSPAQGGGRDAQPPVLPDLPLDEPALPPTRPADARRAPAAPPQRLPGPNQPPQAPYAQHHGRPPHHQPRPEQADAPRHTEPTGSAQHQEQRPGDQPPSHRHRRKRRGGRGGER